MKKTKLNIPICAALVLLFLTMVSIHMTSGLYARYTATSTASDSARVAKFSIEGTKDGTVTISTDTDSQGNYQLTVFNHSEVSVTYSLDFIFDENVDGWMKLKLDENEYSTSTEKGNKVISLGKVGDLAPNSQATHTIIFSVDKAKWSSVTSHMTNKKREWILPFNVDIHATQIN